MKRLIFIILVILILLGTIYFFILKKDIENEAPNEGDYIITYFCLSESSHNDMADPRGNENYNFELSGNTVEIEITGITEKKTIKLKKEQRAKLEQELLALIETHSLEKWNGYDKSRDVLDDFHGFDFTVAYANEKEIYARGSHMFPFNYNEVFEDIQSVFLKLFSN